MGVKPLDVMLEMIRDELASGEQDKQFLLELCKAAAPFVHATMHDSKVTGALEIVHVPRPAGAVAKIDQEGIVDDPFAFRGAFDLIDPGGKVNCIEQGSATVAD